MVLWGGSGPYVSPVRCVGCVSVRGDVQRFMCVPGGVRGLIVWDVSLGLRWGGCFHPVGVCACVVLWHFGCNVEGLCVWGGCRWGDVFGAGVGGVRCFAL